MKPIAIIAGEPNSISSEIIFKAWKKRKKYHHKPFFIIGSIKVLELQSKKLKYNIKIKKLDNKFKSHYLSKNYLHVYNVDYNQKKPFEKISQKSKKYIFNCFELALKLIKNKQILGFINCPISKENLFNNNYQGITEFLAKNSNKLGNEVMLIYNKELAVSPITTHIPINIVSKKLNKNMIINKVKIINYFYKTFLKKKPNIGILGLNPHNFSPSKNSEEKKIIIPAIKSIKKLKIKVIGPISPDTSFMQYKKIKLDVLVGMYHDQVLLPFKSLFNYNAINVTLGLPYFRVSPDHGVGENIIGKNKANPKSLVESIKFFNLIK